jgi:ligand-binding sensor domain-containing protein
MIALSILGAVEWNLQTSQAYVTSIQLSSDGSIWCSTTGGLIHYDTDEGWLDPMIYPDDLPWTGAWDLLLQNSQIWVATTGGGLALLQDGQWEIFSQYEGVPGSGEVFTVHDAGGYVWAGTDGGLARGDENGFLVVDAAMTGGGFQAGRVTDIDNLGDSLYLATDDGVYTLDLSGSIIDPASWSSDPSSQSLGIQKVLVHSADSLFGYGDGGVSVRNGGSWTRILDYSASADSVINGLLMTEDGLIASARVVIIYDGSDWTHYGTNYPVESYGSCLVEVLDRIWCGYGLRSSNAFDGGRGLGYLEEGSWKTLSIPTIGNSSCYQQAENAETIYLGSHRVGLMAHYTDGSWVQFNNLTSPMPKSLRTYSAVTSEDNGVWTSSYHWGLTWIHDNGTPDMDDDTLITYVSDSLSGVSPDVVQILSPLFNNQVIMLSEQNGSIWIAQEAFWQTPDEPSGIVSVTGDPLEGNLQWCTRTETDGLAGKNIQNVLPCGDDSLWIAFASEGGCQLLVHGGNPVDKSSDEWYPGFGQAFNTSFGLPSNQVFCFSRSPEGELVAGTGAGLCRWNGSSFVSIGDVPGTVKAVEFDSRGDIWCITADAIYNVSDEGSTSYTSSNSVYIPTSRPENEFSHFDQSSGIIYFSSLIGLWSIDPGRPQFQGAEPRFYPQPFLPADETLRMAWSDHEGPVTVSFFTISGQHLGEVSSDSWENWSWNGILDGDDVSSGIYFVIVETANGSTTEKIALVR